MKLLFLFAAALIFIASAVPVPSFAVFPHAGALFHGIAYFSLTILGLFLVQSITARFLMLMACWLLGLMIEGLQPLLFARDGTLEDLGYNTLGVTLAGLLFLAVRQLSTRRAKT